MKKTTILALLAVLAVVVAPADAAFEITTFSCNGQGNPAVVESGSAMNCVARITNTDSQNSASIGTATLAVSGGWAEQASYAVVVSDSVLAGGYKDVTFQSIRSITPGDTHAFSDVNIDGSAHTETVSSYRVNALAIKSLTATAPASAATSSTFDVSSTVRAGGNFLGMTLAIGLSGGCSLGSGQSASKGMGTMSNNAQASTSWTVTQGSSDCAVTVTATGTSSPVTVTSTKSATVAKPSGGGTTTTTTTTSAGSGGGGAGGAGTAAASKYIGELSLSKVTQKLALGESVKFAILSVNHTIAVKNITLTNVTIEVNSTPQVATLKTGETKTFDLDSNSVDDISVTLGKIENWEAEFVIELVNPEAIKKIGEEKKKLPEVTITPGATSPPESTPAPGPIIPLLPGMIAGAVVNPLVLAALVVAGLAIVTFFIVRPSVFWKKSKKPPKETEEERKA